MTEANGLRRSYLRVNMTVQEYILTYLKWAGLDVSESKSIITDKFGDSPELADELLDLILAGKKTATCSSVWEYQEEGSEIPFVGMRSVILNGSDEPKCIIETTEVTIRKFAEVDTDFAAEEGEGDKTLNYWREAHRRFFSRTLPKIGREFSENMPLVCERFKVIYKVAIPAE